MKRISLPIGSSGFQDIRKSGNYYVDKTKIISEIIRDNARGIIFTRPRRFGKTTVQSMLASFFDIREDSEELFRGLNVHDDKEAVDNWMNKYPVIYLSFKDTEGASFDNAFAKLCQQIVKTYDSYSFIVSSLSPSENEFFNRILFRTAGKAEYEMALNELSGFLSHYYGENILLIIDEYDVPLMKAEQNGYYSEMLSTIRAIFSSVLKDNPNVKKAILTGCLRISKESLFTGVNNMAVNSLTDSRYADSFGFTESEVMKLLSDAGLSDKAGIIRKWYDGYRIGDESIYAPWDVVRYVDKLQYDRSAPPEDFWADTSGNDVIRRFIEKTNPSISPEYSALISGEQISMKISESLTYRDLYRNEMNIWSLMLSTGYLTLAERYIPYEEAKLRLPNEEIRHLFIEEVDNWFADMAESADRTPLFSAIWNGKDEELSKILTAYLRKTISYYDYSESYYHAFTAGLVASSGYRVMSNRESGNGRPDLIIADADTGKAAIFEFKRSRNADDMEYDAKKALAQIQAMDYRSGLREYDSIICYGVAFFQKTALAISGQ